MCTIEVTDDSEDPECDICYVRKYGQLVTTSSYMTVNSSHDLQ